jgi:cell division protein FtsL
MKKLSGVAIWVLFFALMIGNISVFITGVSLSEDIYRFETEIEQLRQENIELETKVFKAESIEYAASLAADLGYTKKTQPVFFDNDTKYAYNN